MNIIQYITAILLSLEPSYADKETWSERTARMEVIAQAIDDASSKATCEGKYAGGGCQKTWPKDKKSLALLLVTKGFWESHFSKNVHEGKCRAYECDAYKIANKVYHRARSPWQVQKTGMVSEDEYEKMNSASLESTTVSANVAVRYLANGMRLCKTIPGAISSYAGAGCKWKGATPRVNFYNMISKKTDEQLAKSAAERKAKLESRLAREAREKSAKN